MKLSCPMAASDPPAASASPTDAELIAAVSGGDRSAFTPLVRRYERVARAAAMTVLGDAHLARDAAQDAFVTAFEQLSRLRDAQAFAAWLLTAVHRRAMRIARQRRAHRPLHLADETPAAEADPFDEDDKRVLAAIARLPEHERVVVTLRYFHDHDVNTIARLCGRPVGTVTKQLSRAHERLRGWLKGALS